MQEKAFFPNVPDFSAVGDVINVTYTSSRLCRVAKWKCILVYNAHERNAVASRTADNPSGRWVLPVYLWGGPISPCACRFRMGIKN
jgi:hypothetical protein